jgi:hypothetical protein
MRLALFLSGPTSGGADKPRRTRRALAGVREILSASAQVTLTSLFTADLDDTLNSLGVGVGVVVFLLLGLLIVNLSGHRDENETFETALFSRTARRGKQRLGVLLPHGTPLYDFRL